MIATDYRSGVEDEIRRNFFPSQFHYTELDGFTLRHVVSVGVTGWVAVIGQPEWGSYEWVARVDGGMSDHAKGYEHSNAGYGCAASALRDGLIQMLG